MKTYKVSLLQRDVLVNAGNKHCAITVLQEHVGSVADGLRLRDVVDYEYRESNRSLVWGVLSGGLIPGLSGLDRHA